jgi:hypothetical protein
MVENRDEGVIIKDLESKWEPADRSGRWAKVKPDYINVETDLDVLIIGAPRVHSFLAPFLFHVASNRPRFMLPRRAVPRNPIVGSPSLQSVSFDTVCLCRRVVLSEDRTQCAIVYKVIDVTLCELKPRTSPDSAFL